MDFIGDDIQKRVMQMMSGKAEPDAAQHDFFSPMNEMDPFVKQQQAAPKLPKFKFRVFHLAGMAHDTIEDELYIKIMNDIVSGKAVRLEEQTYHTKDGDISVLLRWLEMPEEDKKEAVQQQNSENPVENTPEQAKKGKKSRKKADFDPENGQEMSEARKNSAIPDPEIIM